MNLEINNSVLTLNNHFYKVFKRLNEKKGKNESVSDEIDWINKQLNQENRRICENTVIVLVQYGKSHDFGFSLNSLISSLSLHSNKNYDLIADGIFKLIQYVTDEFGISEKPHPAILLISESSERMLYLSQKIDEIFNSR